jgi:hypothetical protein
MTRATRTYRGQLVRVDNGDDEVVGLRDEHGAESILAKTVSEDFDVLGHYLTVRYFISDVPLTPDQVNEERVKIAIGEGDVGYGKAYSEITGYLWTDEDLKVGGHDLIDELYAHIGKYLHMEIGFSTTPSVQPSHAPRDDDELEERP